MEDVGFDDLPALESDLPLLDEKLVAAEEARRDSRDIPPRQTPIIQSLPRPSHPCLSRPSLSSPIAHLHRIPFLCPPLWQEHPLRLLLGAHAGHAPHRPHSLERHLRPQSPTLSPLSPLPLPSLPPLSPTPAPLPRPVSPSPDLPPSSPLCVQRSQHGVLVALRHPRVSVLVFPSGKVISMGAKSEASAILACRRVARAVQRLEGYGAVKLQDFRLHNVTASGALGYRVDLRAVAHHPAHEDSVEYNPDQFPGLHYKLVDEEALPSVPTVKGEGGVVKAEGGGGGGVAGPVKVEGMGVGEEFSWLRRTPVVRPGVGSAPTSPLTLTVYFSGRYTLVGARHETEVYRVVAKVSRMLWPFRQRGIGGGGDGREGGEGYDQWLERVEIEERRRGKLGWEEEAERVRDLMGRRERKRAELEAMQRGEQREGGGAEVRVKAEPGRRDAGADDEAKAEGKEERAAEGEGKAKVGGVGPQVQGKASDHREAEEEKKGGGAEVRDTAVVVMDTQTTTTTASADDDAGDVEWE